MSASQPRNTAAIERRLQNLWSRLLPYLKSNEQLLPGTPEIEKVRDNLHANWWLTLHILGCSCTTGSLDLCGRHFTFFMNPT